MGGKANNIDQKIIERKTNMIREQSAWVLQFFIERALWFRECMTSQSQPHIAISPQVHSDGFVDPLKLVQDQPLLEEACRDTAELLEIGAFNAMELGRIVCPDLHSMSFANKLRTVLDKKLPEITLQDFGATKEFVLVGKELYMRKILIACIVTSSHSLEQVDEMASNIKQRGGIVLPFIASLINVSGCFGYGGLKIVALINKEIGTWDIAGGKQCSLCREGSSVVANTDLRRIWNT